MTRQYRYSIERAWRSVQFSFFMRRVSKKLLGSTAMNVLLTFLSALEYTFPSHSSKRQVRICFQVRSAAKDSAMARIVLSPA